MKIIEMKANEGKTTRLIEMSISRQIPIIAYETTPRGIMQIAYEKGFDISKLPTPIDVRNINKDVLSKYDSVLVDDLPQVLEYFIGIQVYAATNQKEFNL